MALREGTSYATSGNSYKCNPATTKEDAITFPYQWAFDGDAY
jgi:hypothetical protein